ncbi:hypothetical protein PCE1_003453 [Barthelona sp. PCE]
MRFFIGADWHGQIRQAQAFVHILNGAAELIATHFGAENTQSNTQTMDIVGIVNGDFSPRRRFYDEYDPDYHTALPQFQLNFFVNELLPVLAKCKVPIIIQPGNTEYACLEEHYENACLNHNNVFFCKGGVFEAPFLPEPIFFFPYVPMSSHRLKDYELFDDDRVHTIKSLSGISSWGRDVSDLPGLVYLVHRDEMEGKRPVKFDGLPRGKEFWQSPQHKSYPWCAGPRVYRPQAISSLSERFDELYTKPCRIWFCHAPLRHYFDRNYKNITCGSPGLLIKCDEHKPLVVTTAHIHEAMGEMYRGNSLIIGQGNDNWSTFTGIELQLIGDRRIVNRHVVPFPSSHAFKKSRSLKKLT